MKHLYKQLAAMALAVVWLVSPAATVVDFDAMYELELDASLETPRVPNDKAKRNIVAFQTDLAN